MRKSWHAERLKTFYLYARLRCRRKGRSRRILDTHRLLAGLRNRYRSSVSLQWGGCIGIDLICAESAWGRRENRELECQLGQGAAAASAGVPATGAARCAVPAGDQ